MKKTSHAEDWHNEQGEKKQNKTKVWHAFNSEPQTVLHIYKHSSLEHLLNFQKNFPLYPICSWIVTLEQTELDEKS